MGWWLRQDVIRKRSKILRKGGIEPSFGAILINHIVNRRLENNFNSIFFLAGKNGMGKTWTALRMAEVIQAPRRFNPEKQVAYNPLQYKEVMEFATKKKWPKVVIFDEAQTFVDSRTYHDFINKAISAIQTTFREIKPLAAIWIAPSISDIDKRIRLQTDYYGRCSRPLDYGTRVWLRETYVNDYDIENPRMRYRKIWVVKENEDGKFETVAIDKLVMEKPSQTVVKKYKKMALEHKDKIIMTQMDTIIDNIRSQIPTTQKLDGILRTYKENPELIKFVTARGKININKLMTLHKLGSKKEAKHLKEMLESLYKDMGLVGEVA